MITAPRRILVTGASSGLGLAIARGLSRPGVEVIGTSRDPERAAALAEGGPPILLRPLDFGEVEQIDALADWVAATGGLDLLVQNAGVGVFGAVEEVSQEEAERQLWTNYLAPLRLVRRLLPLLRDRRGQILFVGSLAGRFALPFQADYSASKAAIGALSDALRMELRPHGVRVSCIEPGDFATGFTAARRILRAAGSPYAPFLERALAATEEGEKNGPSPDRVAKLVVRLSTLAHPPARVAVGRWARTLCLLQRALPDAARERLVRMFSGA